MIDTIVHALMFLGAILFLIAGIGLLRLPDVFMRASAVAKVLALATGCLLLAAAIHFHQTAITTRAVVVIAFFFLTSPVSAHLVGRAAYLSKTPLWKGTVTDELRGKYDLKKGILKSTPQPPKDSRKSSDPPPP